MSDLKDKQRAGLIVNWLGREVTQILNSVEAGINSLDEAFEALEKVFRHESNQTLACFKFRTMKQNVAQTCDSYMSELQLALPECKYKNDAYEPLKDQFIFGLRIRRSKTIYWVRSLKQTTASKHCMRPGRLNQSWPKEKCWVL